MADEEVTPHPEPDPRSPAERQGEVVANSEALLLEAARELAGRQMILQTVRSQRRPDQNDIYEAATNFRNAEAQFDQAKDKLVREITTHILRIAQEKAEQ